MEIEAESTTLPLLGDYEYLGDGYYACAEAEQEAAAGLPTCADVLDAYIVPLALERARLAGLPVPEWHLTNEQVEAPAVLYGVNPFARSHVVVREGEDAAAAARKVSRQGKFVMCSQRLPPGGRLVEFDMVMGACRDERFARWAADVHRVFRLPMARVRLIEAGDDLFLSAIERLNRDDAAEGTRRLLNEQALGGPVRG